MKGTIWCLHGAVGMAEDWRGLRVSGWGVKRVNLWRFLDCCPMGMVEFGRALNEEASASSGRKVLLGYSMGGRLALHALLAGGPWEAAVIVSAHPGLEDREERLARLTRDAEWAARALGGEWRGFVEEWNGQEVLGTSNSQGPTLNLEARMEDRTKLERRRRPVARSFVDWSLGAQEPLWERLREIGVPLLWVVGERDGKFRAVGEEAVSRSGGGSARSPSLWVAPGAGHRVPWESSEFPERVGEFLERSGS